ncbi:hypothetical protein LVD15_25455 [Fulvivirga maritima]|uniref:hypothetical protein n=1 Tax=Fulvivirga maritima TaxID=2904247 RepID=UPI001F2705E3|nr:hypothetical protein [Fulvivirga maritima]UII26603.1 hypothetical protein LVD15_25455 [Fulvivirga maritima]
MRSPSFLVVVLILISYGLQAQNISSEHQAKLDQIKDPAKRERLYKKYLRKDAKEMEKQLSENQSDSTSNDSTLVNKAKKEALSIAQDSLQNRNLPTALPIDTTSTLKEKSLKVIHDELDIPTDSAAIKAEAKTRLKNELGTDIPDIKLDSTTVDQAEKELTKRAEEELKKRGDIQSLDGAENSEFSQLENYKDQLEKTQEQMRQADAKQAMKAKMTSQAREFITQHADKIQEVQSKMNGLKKKYSYVPNSNDLSTAKKRNSLEDKTFWERISLGGNFNVSKTNPVTVDLSPVIAYKLNKVSEIGITGSYRTEFGADKSGLSGLDDETYGFGVFGNHTVFNNFMVQLEGECLRTTTGSAEQNERSWKQTLLLGIGRRFKVTKWLEMQTLVMFNVLHNPPKSPYPSPVVFKTGFRIVK